MSLPVRTSSSATASRAAGRNSTLRKPESRGSGRGIFFVRADRGGDRLAPLFAQCLAEFWAAQAAIEGDAVASAILMRAGGALAVLVQGVTAALFAGAVDEFAVARVGGLWAAGPPLTDVFERSVRRFAPLAVPVVPRQSPVWGAARQARQLLSSPS